MENKILVYVVKIGSPPYASYTEPFIRQYCRRHGYPLLISPMRRDENRHPSWEKLLAFNYVDYDFVLLMDLDIVPVPNAPPIHPELAEDKLNLVPLRPGPVARGRLRRLGYPVEKMKWNTGLVGVPRSLSHVLEDVYDNYKLEKQVWMEQGPLNLSICDRDVAVNEIPGEWNHWVNVDLQEPVAESHFLHLAGNKWRRIRNAKRLKELYSIDLT